MGFAIAIIRPGVGRDKFGPEIGAFLQQQFQTTNAGNGCLAKHAKDFRCCGVADLRLIVGGL